MSRINLHIYLSLSVSFCLSISLSFSREIVLSHDQQSQKLFVSMNSSSRVIRNAKDESVTIVAYAKREESSRDWTKNISVYAETYRSRTFDTDILYMSNI